MSLRRGLLPATCGRGPAAEARGGGIRLTLSVSSDGRRRHRRYCSVGIARGDRERDAASGKRYRLYGILILRARIVLVTVPVPTGFRLGS